MEAKQPQASVAEHVVMAIGGIAGAIIGFVLARHWQYSGMTAALITLGGLAVGSLVVRPVSWLFRPRPT